MGLKYSVFLMKIDSKEFLDRLVKAGFIDKTEIYKKKKRWDSDQIKAFQRIAKDTTISHDEKLKLILKNVDEEPEDKEIAAIIKRDKDQHIKDLSIWWARVPKYEDYIFGSFTMFRFYNRDFQAFLSAMFAEIGFQEWVFVDYHHGSNEGTIFKMTKELKPEFYEDKEDEHERYEKYAARITKTINYPIIQVHRYLQDLPYEPVPWEKTVNKNLIQLKGDIK